MDDVLFMQMVKPSRRLLKKRVSYLFDGPIGMMIYLETDSGDLLFGHVVVINDIGQGAAFHVFHDHPQVSILDQERVQKVDNVGMLRFFHDKDFIDDQFLAGLVSEIHLLDGDFGVGC
jgi:hypothetical protein